MINTDKIGSQGKTAAPDPCPGPPWVPLSQPHLHIEWLLLVFTSVFLNNVFMYLDFSVVDFEN